jgi:hypothetical protein
MLIWMNTRRAIGALVIAILALTLLGGCSGLPGAPGASGQAQQGPPGLTAPPGMKTGGARTVLGTTVTAPDNYVVSVKYSLAPNATTAANAVAFKGAWHHCQRILVSDGVILIEGIDFDIPNATTETQSQILLPVASVADIAWKYEPENEKAATAKAASTKPTDANAAKPNAPAKGTK